MTRKDGPGLILAVDVKRPAEAERILDLLKENLRYVKIGPRLFAAGGMQFVRRVMRAGFRVFLDLKLHDIPNTVAEAVDLFARKGIWALTLHASGGEEMLRAAVSAKAGVGSSLMLLGVTVLTSMDQISLDMISPGSALQGTILSRARLCEDCGLEGIVCSQRSSPRCPSFHGQASHGCPRDQGRSGSPGRPEEDGLPGRCAADGGRLRRYRKTHRKGSIAVGRHVRIF